MEKAIRKSKMTPHQADVIIDLLKSKEKIVFFTAPGGYGKTKSIAEFIESLPGDKSVMVTSTTHQALSVLNDMIPEEHDCHVGTATIHSFLGFKIQYDGKGGQDLKFTGGSKFDGMQYDYLIIDEVSMLPLIINEKIHEGLDQILEKIIYVGDESQLSISDFLNLDDIEKYRLEVNMRQDKDSPINVFSQALRHEISTKGNPIPIPYDDYHFILHKTHEEFIKAYKESESPDKYIIAYMNKTVTKYNHSIKQYMKKADLYSKDDKIILLEPHKKGNRIVYNNRERLTIVGPPVEQKYPVRINEKPDFDYYEFVVENSKEKRSTIKVPRTKTDFLMQTNHLRDKALVSGNWRPFYAFKEEYNFVHHAFAGTVYSAQGSTYDEVFIDLADFAPPKDPFNQTLLRMVYVAISRARKRVHVFNSNEGRDFTKFA